MTSDFSLVVCELFNPAIHGFNHSSDSRVLSHHLILDNELDDLSYNELNEVVEFHQDRCEEYEGTDLIHPTIRNYDVISSDPNYIQLQIAKVLYLNGGECVGIIKTIWIKLIQRTWKNVLKKRREINLFHGGSIPSIRGMLSALSSRGASE